ncbi:MAG: sensor histidine kinase [Actinobacteria bacterium]|nr:sensor histidine kinase [Actinomycetota bacterium]MCA1720836.1 sensor histidine kinase [Actinomycetota bacterium]
MLTGVVAVDLPNPTRRSRRRQKQEPERRVKQSQLAGAAARALELGPGVVEDHTRARAEMMKQLESDPELHKSMADQLRKDFEENLNQSHDFLQLVKLVRGHAEALLLQKFPDLDSTDAAERSPIEGAIFFSTELMLVKMDALVFLNEISRALGNESRFRIHSLVLKYVRIYDWQARQKDLGVRLEGETYAWARYNSEAVGAVTQALLDNLVKYAPADSKAVVTFEEDADSVLIRFTSLGPRIEADETSRIFLPGYRARAARRVEDGGMGVGLATAKKVSDALGLELSVDQADEADDHHPERYRTCFQVRMRKN